MKVSIVVAVVLFVSSMIGMQDATKDPPKKVSLDSQVKILQVLRREDQMSNQFTQCRSIIESAPNNFSKAEAEKQEYIEGALKEAGLDKSDWEINLENFEFKKKKSADVKSEAKPEDKKP